VLSTGAVLVFGGVTSGYGEATEIYDPTTDTWADGPSMYEARSYAAPLRLEDGRWLVAGGFNRPNRRTGTVALSSVEIFEE